MLIVRHLLLIRVRWARKRSSILELRGGFVQIRKTSVSDLAAILLVFRISVGTAFLALDDVDFGIGWVVVVFVFVGAVEVFDCDF